VLSLLPLALASLLSSLVDHPDDQLGPDLRELGSLLAPGEVPRTPFVQKLRRLLESGDPELLRTAWRLYSATKGPSRAKGLLTLAMGLRFEVPLAWIREVTDPASSWHLVEQGRPSNRPFLDPGTETWPVQRAAALAAMGRHNLLLEEDSGTSRGGGVASWITESLPKLTDEQDRYLRKLNPYWGRERDGTPPFRSPHFSAKASAILGGLAPGEIAIAPGELAMASHGVYHFYSPCFYRTDLDDIGKAISAGQDLGGFLLDPLLVAVYFPGQEGDLRKKPSFFDLFEIQAPLFDSVPRNLDLRERAHLATTLAMPDKPPLSEEALDLLRIAPAWAPLLAQDPRLLGVAQTIAQLDFHEEVSALDLAEAIRYWPHTKKRASSSASMDEIKESALAHWRWG